MDVRSPFYRNLALIIAGVMFLNPIVATAAQLAVDGKAAGNTSLSQAGNGVPVVNIATPNGKGLSHNKFSDYNVGQQGLILNNVTGRTQATQLGGIIVGNPNLQGKAAGMILNEVTGANPSQLRGYTEVAGQAARVIVANPHGITCDGCGFINTPRATLSTGRPVIEDGRLSRFDVDGGQITIEGAGLNASNVEQFDLITRSAKINAELHANTLNIVTGRNAVDADNLAATAKADDGSDKPMLALDSSVLGGMYAGAIRLVGTEGGVGVKLAGDMAASAGDIQIDAAGKLTLANTSASGNLAINAVDVALAGQAYAGGKADISAQSTLTVQQSLAAAGNVSLQGKQVINRGVVEAGVNADNSRVAADLQVSAEQLRNAGSMISNRQLQVEAAQLLDNRAGTLSAKGRTQIDAGQLDNRSGRVLAGSTLNLSAADVDNRQTGLIRSQGAADVQVAGVLHNQQGQLVSEATLAVQAQQVNNQAGQLIAGQALQLQAQAIDNSAAGVISAQADAQIVAQSLSNAQAGEVSAGAKLGLNVTQLDNSDNGTISGAGALTLQAGHVDNRDKGRISSQGAVTANLSGLDQQGGGQFVSRGGLTLDLAGGRLNNSRQGLLATPGSLLLTNVASIDNSQGGEISSDQAFTLVTTELNNSAGKILSGEALELRVTQALLNNLGGLLSAGKQLNVRAASLNNSGAGQVSSRGDMRLELAGEVNNHQQGLIVADGGLHLAAARIDNSEDGEISSQNELTLVADSLNNSDGGRIIGEGGLNARLENLDNRRNGLLASNADLVLHAKQIDNSAGGTLSGVQLLTLSAETLNNQSAGRVLSGGALQVTLNELNNSDTGLLSSRGDLLLHGSALNNRGGTVVVDGQGQIVADSLDSSAGGLISASQGLSISAETLSNQGGELSSAANLNIQAARLDNSAAGKVIAGNALSLTVAQLLNQAKGVLSGAHSLTLSGVSLDNSGAGLLLSQGAIDLELSEALNNREGGSLLAQGPLHVQAASLDNSQDGLLSSKAGMTVALTGELNNQAGALIADGALQLDAQHLDNREQGVLSSKGNLRLGANQVDNRSGSIVSDASLDLKAEGLNNSQGQVASKGDLDVELDHLVQQGGELLSQGSLRLAADDIDNSQAGLIAATQGVAITTGTLSNSGGEISSTGAVAIDAAELNNSAAGLVLGDAGLQLTVQRLLNHSLGVLSGRTGLVVRGDSLDNSQGGILTSQQMLDVQLSGALDNHDQGALLSEGALQLQAGALNNTRGVLSSAGALAITTGTLNNQGGKLVTDDQLNITSSALDNSQGGRISAKQALSIVTGQLDNQRQGLISGAAALHLTTDQLNNHNRGLITAKGAVQVRASGLDQHQGGELFSESALTLDLQGGALNNSGQGLIATPGALLLNNLGSVDNSAGGEISSNQSFLLNASQLNNSAGRVISGHDLQLQITQALLNNLKGVLSAAKLSVAAASLDNSAAGVLASKGDIQVTLTGTLDNHDQGIVSAAQALSISSVSLDNSGDGLLASGGDLQLNTGALNNQGGSLLSQAALDVSSAALDNRGGALSSQQGLTLSAAAVDNRDNGLITSAAGLTLSATTLDSSAGGEVSAKQDLQLTVSQLIQQQGRLISEAGLRVDLNGGDLDNRGGLLSAQGPLSLLNLGTLDNRNAGEVSSTQSYSLTAKAIDNGEQGRLISAGNLGLDVGTGALRNANGGLISGWQGLTLNAGNLDNSALGTLSSRDGALTVNLKGSERVLNNSGAGALVSKGALSIEAGSLNNSGQGILSSEGDLELRLTGALNNSDRGLIDSQGSLTANAGAVNNHSGQIGSAKAANVNAASLDNQAGQLTSNAALNLTLTGNLINTLGKLASTGPLVLKTQAIDNLGGSLLSQSLLELTASSLSNANGGTLAARNGLNLLLTGALNNSVDGLIHSQQGAVDIRAQSLNNNGGTLGSQSDLRLALDGQLDNQGGHIQSRAGNLDLQQASAVDNSGGVLSSLTGWLKLATAGLFNNDAGTTQAQALTISAQGVDNRGGHISALSGDTAINIGSSTFNNQGGGLYAHQLLDVIAGTFNNQGAGQDQGGKVAAGQIDFGLSGALNNSYGILESSSTLGLAAASLNNRYGSVRALGTSGDTRITATSLDNRNGSIETANSNLDLNVASLQSAGGSILHVGTGNFGLSAAQVSGAGGDLRSNGLLNLTADNWTNSGVLQAGRLVLNVGTFTQTASGQLLANQSFTGSGSTWTNNGLLASDGSFSLNLTGAYSGSGQVTSLGNLTLSAGSINLSSSAHVTGGGLTTITSAGLLSNSGKLTSADNMVVAANILNNFGTLGSAENLRISTPALMNERGLVFSGGDMALWVNEFTNKYADVYSLGELIVAKDNKGALLNVLENISGTLESVGDMSLSARQLINRKDVFEVTLDEYSSAIGVRCTSCTGSMSASYYRGYYPSHLVWERNYNSRILNDSPGSKILSGGGLAVFAKDVLNSNSLISSADDLVVTTDSLDNIGSSIGSYTLTQYLNIAPGQTDSGGVGASREPSSIWRDIVEYNAYNDQEYNRDIRFWDAQGNQTFVESRLVVRPPGTDGDGGDTLSEVSQNFATISCCEYATRHIRTYSGSVNEFFDAIDFNELTKSELKSLSGIIFFEESQYASGIRKDAPGEIKNAAVFKETLESGAGTQKVSAIIQAGGSVSISAISYINNGVERSGLKHAVGDSRLGNTSVQRGSSSVFVDLNRQLPANLQQQQVNPLTLPGFTLPQGENGLFRLSGQQAQSTNATQASGAVVDRTLAGRSVALGQQEQSLSAVDIQGRSIAVTTRNSQAATQVAASDPQLSGSAPGLQVSSSADSVQSALSDQGVFTGVPSAQTAILDAPAVPQLPQAQGFSVAPPSSHKYLIETNPELTNLKQFMGSDYLLGNLGYDPDAAQKRLGDGLYEQRLVRDAVVARTGQRFLAGLTSDEAMYRYLMDNALASKDALGLSLGVTLSSEQVAALTHDIVWLEEHEVNGEKVLVPVLYLAQAEGRLAANGALIQGRDVTLISGGELLNQGTLRASENLIATAGNINNSGLIEAGERLQLLATDSIRNAQGGIIAGRDVSLTALTGDVINERSATRQEVNFGNHHEVQDYVDSAARIEAANSLNIVAGRDVANLGAVLVSGGDLSINAGRDVTFASVEERVSQASGNRYLNERVTQLGAQASAGRDLEISAGRDLSAISSQLDARRDLALEAGGDMLLASAANESHFLSKSKKVIRQTDHVDQQATTLSAGGDVYVGAEGNLILSASKIAAGDEAYLVAGENLALLSAEDYDYSLYQKKSKGSFGRKSFKRNESTQVTQVGSEITTGGDLTLVSDDDQLYQRARLDSGNDLTLVSGGEITFEGVKDLKQESREKSKGSFAWQSAKGKGTTDETLQQSQLSAQGEIVIQAVEGLNIDLKQVNRQTVSQTIGAMVQADPNLAWLQDMEQRGDVDWRRVKEVHDSFKYSSSGLGAGASMVIAIAVAYFTAGAMSGLVANGATAAGASTAATSAGGAWAAGTGASLSGIGWANAAVTAGLTGMTSNAAISTINNRGDLGAVLKDVTSEDALRGYVVAGATAGLTNGLYDGWIGTETGTAGAIQGAGKVIADGGLASLEGIGRFAGNQLLQNGTSTVLDRALGGDSSFSDALRSSVASTFAAAGFNLIGDVTAKDQWNLADGSPAKVAMHAVMGGLAAEAAGGDFKTGALAAGVNELLVDKLATQYGEMDPDQKKSLLVMNSQVIGVLAAAAQGGDEQAMQVGSQVAGAATQYNYLLHREETVKSVEQVMERCQQSPECAKRFAGLDSQEVLNAFEVMAAKDEQALSAVGSDARLFAAEMLRWDVSLGERIFIPETPLEKAYDAVKTANEWAGVLAGAGGAAVAVKTGIKSLAGVFARSGAKGIGDIFKTGRTPKASELKQYAEAQGWKPSQTEGGPLKYVDGNGIPRVTIKQGSSRAPGSADPHVEFKDAAGQRTDAFGNPVTRKSPGNHTSINFDL